MSRKSGYIELHWEVDDHPEYVYGHVSNAEAIETIEAAGIELPDAVSVRHCYAMWTFAPHWMSHTDRWFKVCEAGGRGKFPVTEVEK